MADEFKVDLSELEGTLRSLSRLMQDMEGVHGDSQYRTDLSEHALGRVTDFTEANELSSAHKDMQNHLREVMGVLKSLIDDFRTNAMHVHGKYQDAEYESKNGMAG